MKTAGLKATFHTLRHTHASTLIAAGIDVLTISRRLGHGSPSVTLGVYGHLFKTDDRAAEAMEKALRHRNKKLPVPIRCQLGQSVSLLFFAELG
jgi:integrase